MDTVRFVDNDCSKDDGEKLRERIRIQISQINLRYNKSLNPTSLSFLLSKECLTTGEEGVSILFYVKKSKNSLKIFVRKECPFKKELNHLHCSFWPCSKLSLISMLNLVKSS